LTKEVEDTFQLHGIYKYPDDESNGISRYHIFGVQLYALEDPWYRTVPKGTSLGGEPFSRSLKDVIETGLQDGENRKEVLDYESDITREFNPRYVVNIPTVEDTSQLSPRSKNDVLRAIVAGYKQWASKQDGLYDKVMQFTQYLRGFEYETYGPYDFSMARYFENISECQQIIRYNAGCFEKLNNQLNSSLHSENEYQPGNIILTLPKGYLPKVKDIMYLWSTYTFREGEEYAKQFSSDADNVEFVSVTNAGRILAPSFPGLYRVLPYVFKDVDPVNGNVKNDESYRWAYNEKWIISYNGHPVYLSRVTDAVTLDFRYAVFYPNGIQDLNMDSDEDWKIFRYGKTTWQNVELAGPSSALAADKISEYMLGNMNADAIYISGSTLNQSN
jgi:hypothetical protein